MTRSDYTPRELAGPVQAALAEMPVVAVTGLRQSGKSTFLRRDAALPKRRYVSLDEFEQLAAARANPRAFLGEEPLTIDEAQRCPELLLAIKVAVDQDRRPGRFLLSGSANFSLLRGVSESLAGRAVHFTMHPFTRRERLGVRSTPFLRHLFDAGAAPRTTRSHPLSAEEILGGGLPPVALGQTRPQLWFRGYEQTYLERDVRDLARLGDIVGFRRLLHLAALRTAQVLNVSDLARDAHLSSTTAGRWLDILEASFVTTRLAPWLSNRTSRLIKSPKLYVSDSGLAAHLTGLGRDDAGGWGALVETYVAQNLAALIEAHWHEARLAFWHIQGRHEVDFVVESGRDCLAVEVKWGERWDERALAGLRAFLAATPRCRAAVLAHGGRETVSLGERLWAVPLWRVLE